jgi:hypothetical protein
MKTTFNYILIAAFSLLLSLNLYSQSLGLGAGLNISQLNFNSGDTTEFGDYKSVLGLNIGVHYDVKFSDRVGMRIGLAYSSKGVGYKSGYNSSGGLAPSGDVAYSSSSIVESETRLNYMQLNPMLKFTLPVGEKTTFYTLVGPYLSIGLKGNLSERQTYAYTDNVNPINNLNIDVSNDDEIQFGQEGSGFDYVNYGFTPVIGFQLNSFFIEVSYDIGLNDIQTNNEDNFKAYDRTCSIRLGYLFEK